MRSNGIRTFFYTIFVLAVFGAFFSAKASAKDLYSDLKKYDKVATPPGLEIEGCENDLDACDHVKWKLAVVYNLLYQSPSTHPAFYESYEAPPESCFTMKASASYDKSAHWSCVFFGIKEAIKYQLLNLATAKCTDRVDLETIATHWNRAQTHCTEKTLDHFFPCLTKHSDFDPKSVVQQSFLELSRLSSELGMLRKACQNYIRDKGARILKSDPCRVEEYLKFEELVTDFEWLRSNADRIATWQPGFEPHRTPYYFYIRNSCDQKTKSQKKYIKPEFPKNQCGADVSASCSEAAKTTAETMFHIVAKLEESESISAPTKSDELTKDQIRKAIHETFKEKSKDKNLSSSQKATLKRLAKDEAYLSKLTSHYQTMTSKQKTSSEKQIKEIKRNLDSAIAGLFKEKQKTIAPKNDLDLEFALEEDSPNNIELDSPAQKKQSSTDVKIEEKSPAISIQNDQNKKPASTPLKQIQKTEPPKLSRDEQNQANSKQVRSKPELTNEGKKALTAFKDGKESKFQYSDFFLETETHEKKEKDGVTTSDADFTNLYTNWLSSKKKYKDIANKHPGSDTEKIMAVMKELHQEYGFQYTLPFAHMTDMLNNKGGNCLAETKFITAVIKDLKLKPNSEQVYGVQVFDDHIQPVLYDKSKDEITILVDGTKQKGLVAPVFKSEVLIHQYLVGEKQDPPTKYEDFMIQDISKEVKEKALEASKEIFKNGLSELIENRLHSNSNLNFKKTGIFFSANDASNPPPMHANINWSAGEKKENSTEFYSNNKKVDSNLWQGRMNAMALYEAPQIDFKKAKSDMHKLLTGSTFQEFMKLKSKPGLLNSADYNATQIQSFLSLQDEIYKILKGEAYVSGKNKSDGVSDLQKLLGKEFRELTTFYDQLEFERKPFSKTGDEGNQEKKAYFDFFKQLGPEKWVSYRKLLEPHSEEFVLANALNRNALQKENLSDLDAYFVDPEKVSFITKYKTNEDQGESAQPRQKQSEKSANISEENNEAKTIQANKLVHSSSVASSSKVNPKNNSPGFGEDPNGISLKPEREGLIKLTPIEFAQYIQQANLVKDVSSSVAANSRWSPALTAALRNRGEYPKSFVEWYTSKGYRAVSSSRPSESRVITGPDTKPIPKDLAVLLVDFIRAKNKTGANTDPLLSEIEKNFGSVEKYIEQIKTEFAKKEQGSKDSKKAEDSNDTFEVFKKIAKTRNIDLDVLDRAEKNSFRFHTRAPETFPMGSDPKEKGHANDENQRTVSIKKPYRIQMTPVTQLQWYLVMGENPSNFKTDKSADNDFAMINGTSLNLNHPVEKVSWDEVQQYISKLGKLDGKCTYRLPTEAEWEAAARAKTKTAYSFGNDPDGENGSNLSRYAWFGKNSGSRTHAVATKAPNPEGLYDFHGNVWQWVQDIYTENPTGSTDPLGATVGNKKVIRGGAYYSDLQFLRSATREALLSSAAYDAIGFRLVRECP